MREKKLVKHIVYELNEQKKKTPQIGTKSALILIPPVPFLSDELDVDEMGANCAVIHFVSPPLSLALFFVSVRLMIEQVHRGAESTAQRDNDACTRLRIALAHMRLAEPNENSEHQNLGETF